MGTDRHVPRDVDTTHPNVARIYDYMLGGRDNFEVDRSVADAMLERNPDSREIPMANRRWLRRVVHWLAGPAGIDQFLDLGSGLPTVENTHQIAQEINPDAVVVYVDNDPVVTAYGRALLEENDRTFFVAADLRRPDEVIRHPGAMPHLDLDRPLAVLHCFTLHFIAGEQAAAAIVAGYAARLVPGSYVAISHLGGAEPDAADSKRWNEGIEQYRNEVAPELTPRSATEVETLFGDLELVEPGVVALPDWWSQGPADDAGGPMRAFGGLARKA